MDNNEDKDLKKGIDILYYIIAIITIIIALIYFIKGVLQLIDDGNIYYKDKTGFLTSTVVLIAFVWYRFVDKNKK